MSQVSWRAEPDLVVRVKQAAAAQGCSMNEFMTLVLDVATDPDRAADAHAALCERLRLAGLLADRVVPQVASPRPEQIIEAGRALLDGPLLSDLVIDDRR